MGYGTVISKIRKSKKLSVRAFEELTGVSYSHIALLEKEGSHIGKGKTAPSIAILKQICDRTGYPFRQFLEEAGYIEPVGSAVVERPQFDLTDKHTQAVYEMYNALPNLELKLRVIEMLSAMLEGAGIDSRKFLAYI